MDSTGPVPPAVALPAGTLRVSALARRIHAAIQGAFPRRLWVVGEIAELERGLHRQHWFFRLCEAQADDGRRYALGAVIWNLDQKRLFGPHGVLNGVMEPKDGIEIRALVDVDFYGPNGDLRLVVREIDPAYTLGRIALERQKLLEALAKEGVLERQKRLALAEVPLTIGLITSAQSAAWNDFVEELRRAGVAYRVLCFDARMQGEDTVRTVVAGLKTLAARGVDAIALIRGGGSTVDLAWFDREPIARAIAGLKVPVLTGIGHEIDTSVADFAAHLSFKTPTAVAAFLNERAHAALRGIAESRERLACAEIFVRSERESLAEQAAALVRSTLQQVRAQQALVEEMGRELGRLPPRRLIAEHLDLRGAASRFRSSGALRAPLLEAQRIAEARRRIERGVAAAIERATERLAALGVKARLLDPLQVLRRGFALLRAEDGTIVKDSTAARPGDRIVAELRDGKLAAVVDGAPKPGANHGPTKTRRRPAVPTRQLEIW